MPANKEKDATTTTPKKADKTEKKEKKEKVPKTDKPEKKEKNVTKKDDTEKPEKKEKKVTKKDNTGKTKTEKTKPTKKAPTTKRSASVTKKVGTKVTKKETKVTKKSTKITKKDTKVAKKDTKATKAETKKVVKKTTKPKVQKKETNAKFTEFQLLVLEAIAANANEEHAYVSKFKIKDFVLDYKETPPPALNHLILTALQKLHAKGILKLKKESYAFTTKGKAFEPQKPRKAKVHPKVTEPEPEAPQQTEIKTGSGRISKSVIRD